MSELATVIEGSLVLEADQNRFTPAQVAALTHIGVENAAEGDLQVFHHVCQRTGLDPFARQIHMIGRQVSVYDDQAGGWTKVTKQTIQTGIDGFRLIGRRAANKSGHSVSVGAPEWAHAEQGWQSLWASAWGHPVAARVTIMRAGEPFTAVALFDEYKQTKRSGDLTSMWAQRPAGQLAKCAEALAWRMAFPQDLSGIYSDEEMAQADNPQHVQAEVVRPTTGGLEAALSDPDPDPGASTPAESPAVQEAAGEDEQSGSGSRPLTNRTAFGKAFYARLSARKFDSDQARLEYIVETIGRFIESTKEMTEAEAAKVLARMDEEDGITHETEAQS